MPANTELALGLADINKQITSLKAQAEAERMKSQQVLVDLELQKQELEIKARKYLLALESDKSTRAEGDAQELSPSRK